MTSFYPTPIFGEEYQIVPQGSFWCPYEILGIMLLVCYFLGLFVGVLAVIGPEKFWDELKCQILRLSP